MIETVTEVMRNRVHHLFRDIHTPTVPNMSSKIHIREQKLTNKLTINKDINLKGA